MLSLILSLARLAINRFVIIHLLFLDFLNHVHLGTIVTCPDYLLLQSFCLFGPNTYPPKMNRLKIVLIKFWNVDI